MSEQAKKFYSLVFSKGEKREGYINAGRTASGKAGYSNGWDNVTVHCTGSPLYEWVVGGSKPELLEEAIKFVE